MKVFALPDDGNSVYGVTANGHSLASTPTSAFLEQAFNAAPRKASSAASIRLGLNVQWAGIATPPQDLDINGDGFGGDLTDVLFAITTNGDIYAIDTDLNNGTGAIVTPWHRGSRAVRP